MHRLLDQQIDDDGLHRSRSAKVQVQILVELITIRQALRRDHEQYANEFTELLESMHRALDAISLGTGEPAYFNGTGQMPHDLIVAVQAQSPARARATGTAGGYGRLICGPLDRGGRFGPGAAARISPATPMPARWPSSSAMAATWWCAIAARRRRAWRTTRCCSGRASPIRRRPSTRCRPPPSRPRGPLAGRLVQIGTPAEIEADEADHSLVMRCHGYDDRFGVAHRAAA